jgi:hypothetical protein
MCNFPSQGKRSDVFMVMFVKILVCICSMHPTLYMSLGSLGIIYIPSMDPVEESIFDEIEYKELYEKSLAYSKLGMRSKTYIVGRSLDVEKPKNLKPG